MRQRKKQPIPAAHGERAVPFLLIRPGCGLGFLILRCPNHGWIRTLRSSIRRDSSADACLRHSLMNQKMKAFSGMVGFVTRIIKSMLFHSSIQRPTSSHKNWAYRRGRAKVRERHSTYPFLDTNLRAEVIRLILTCSKKNLSCKYCKIG